MMSSSKGIIRIYTDGSSRGNPGPGGYGITMDWVGKNYYKEFSQGFRKTTNNRMELMAVIVALEKIKINNTKIEVYTDSKYVSDAINKGWINKWKANSFKKTKNVDLWKWYLEVEKEKSIKFYWVKGHNNNPFNERCDVLAVESSKEKNLMIDSGYENSI